MYTFFRNILFFKYPTENNRKSLNPDTVMAMKILPHTAYDTGSAGLSSRIRHGDKEA